MTVTLSAQAQMSRARPLHPVLPDGMERDPFVRLVQRVAQHDGISRAAMNTFVQLTSMTLPSDWSGSAREPCVYANASEIAKRLSISEGRLRAHCAILARAGLINRLTGANGSRSREAGTGIFFRSLFQLAPDIIARDHQLDAERKAAMHLRGQRSTHRRCLAQALAELHRLASGDVEVISLEEAFKNWPGADDLHKMQLEALIRHEAEADSLCRTALNLLEKRTKSSDRPLEFERSHIQEGSQEGSVCVPAAKKSAIARNAAEDGRAEKNSEEKAPLLQSAFLERLTPERLYHLAGPDLQLYLAGRDAPERLRFHDFLWAAERRLAELSIDRRAWDAACDEMGPDTAMMTILILDARATLNQNTPIVSPPAYFNGMRQAFRQGKLNLIQSLIGLSEHQRDVR